VCARCDEIDQRIERFKIVAARFTDEHLLQAIAAAIAELEQEKAALHSKQM
jgi:hypothetical protein